MGLKLGRGLKPFVLKRVRLVKIVDLGQVRIGKDLRKNAPLCALPWNDLAVLDSDPTALPAVLVLPVFGITYAGLGSAVVAPHLFPAFRLVPVRKTAVRGKSVTD